jgi:hypothetical protein
MKHFIIYNSQGEIVRSGQVPDEDFELQVNAPGEYILEGRVDLNNDSVDPKTKEVVRGGRPKRGPRPLSYADKRRSLYPSALDQLELIWKAMDSGKLPKDNEFYTTIKLIKDQYPKDTVPAAITNNLTPKAI